MTAYRDASALAMLVLQDSGWQMLTGWIEDRSAAVALSDFGWGELISAIALRARRGLLTHDVGTTLILQSRAYTKRWASTNLTTADLALATDLVADFDRGLKLPDAIHIATAIRLGALFVTADTRQGRAAMQSGLTVFSPLIGDAVL